MMDFILFLIFLFAEKNESRNLPDSDLVGYFSKSSMAK